MPPSSPAAAPHAPAPPFAPVRPGSALTVLRDTRGLTTVEYIMVLALVAVVGFTAWQNFGQTVVAKIGMSEAAIASIGGAGASGAGGAAGFDVGGSIAAVTASDPGAPATGADGSSTTAGDSATPADDTSDIWGEDGALGRGDATGAEAIARGVADGAADVVMGTVDGVMALGSGIWDAVTNPRDTAAAVAHAVTNPRETAAAAYDTARTVVTGAIDAGSAMVHACGSGDAYACSRGMTNVVAAVIPVGAAGTAARSVGAVRAGTNGVNRVHMVAARGDFASPGVADRANTTVASRGSGSTDDWIQKYEVVDRNHAVIGPQTIIPGHAMNVTTDRLAVPSITGDSFEVAGHASAGGRTLNGFETRDVARQMVRDGEYRGGDVVLRACQSACSPLPQSLRNDLNMELARQGHTGRVGTIAAPTRNVNGLGDVADGGHWKLFDEDTRPDAW